MLFRSLFLHILKRLCAPDLNKEQTGRVADDELTKTWPDHFNETIRILNARLLPALKFSLKELMLGLIVNTKPSDSNKVVLLVTESDAATQMAYVGQQRLDGYAEAVAHALRRKTAFDRKVIKKEPSEVEFTKGQLIQIYRSDLDYTFKMERKLLPKWSSPQQVISKQLNSYTIESLKGDPMPGMFSMQQLRKFTPKEGMKWAEEQKLIEEWCAEEENERRRKEEGEIAEERLNKNQVITTAHTNELLTNTTNHEERMVDEESRDRSDQGNEGTATRRGGHMEYALAQTPD